MKLTPYVKKAYEDAGREHRRVVLSTERLDKDAAMEAIRRARSVAYKAMELSQPSFDFMWFPSPRAAMKFLAEASADVCGRKRRLVDSVGGEGLPNAYRKQIDQPFDHRLPSSLTDLWRIRDAVKHVLGIDKVKSDGTARNMNSVLTLDEVGQFSVSLWRYVFAHERLDVPTDEPTSKRLDAMGSLMRACSFWWNHDKLALVSERPTKIEVDDAGRLHSLTGPALTYSDDFERYVIHGVEVEPEIVTSPAEALTPFRIEKERNVEVRRVLLNLYGEERYLRQTGATVIHEGRKGSKLWWRMPRNAVGWRGRESGTIFTTGETEPLVMVEVVNSTAEPDGSYKRYFLRIPPHIRDADEAVAWTFGLTKEQYVPLIET